MNNYKLNISVRIILILLSSFLLLYLFNNTEAVITPVIILLIIVLQVYLLFKYIDLRNRILTNFLQSLHFSDFSQSIAPHNLGNSFNQLTNELNNIRNKIKDARTTEQEKFLFLENLLHKTNVGLIVYNNSGEIIFNNNIAKKLLNVNPLKSITELNIQTRFKDFDFLHLKSGDNKTIIHEEENETTHISISVSEFKNKSDNYTLLSIKDIKRELNEKEIESWQKLIKVLTHEIMNSITPISSLSSTAHKLLESNENINEEYVTDIKNAVSTIKNRSDGLLKFVDKYRSLTKIPKPKLNTFLVSDLFNDVKNLMQNQIDKNNIEFNCKVIPAKLELLADKELIEQVLINLILNSIFAVKDNNKRSICLSAYKTVKNKIELTIKDNGCGIDPSIKDQIFVPFYTTKQNGSGIGLSLAKQIINSHKGEIRVTSKINEGSIFYLVF